MIITDESKLNFVCKEASIFEANAIIAKLEKELEESGVTGIGLAANQIGIDARVCIIRIPNGEPIDLVNPVILDQNDLMEFDGEGCLSYPGKFATTARHNEIYLRDAIHPNGIVCTGLAAVVVEHEVGHLYGEVFTDYIIDIISMIPNSLMMT